MLEVQRLSLRAQAAGANTVLPVAHSLVRNHRKPVSVTGA